MKRLSALLCLLNIWMAASMLLVFDYTEVRVNVYRGSALGLPDAFYEFSVYRPQTPSSGEINKLRDTLTDLADESQLVLVFQASDSFGIGLYDPAGYYQAQPLASGRAMTFESASPGADMLLRSESYTADHLIKDNTYLSPAGSLNPVGLYDARHPLDIKPYEYIFDFRRAAGLDGIYTIYSKDITVYDRLHELMVNHGYVFHYERLPDQRGYAAFLAQLMQDTFFPGMMLGLLLIYTNYFVFSLRALARLRRAAAIHFLVGATKRGFLREIRHAALPGIALGSALGWAAFALLLASKPRPMTSHLYAAAFLIHLALSALTLLPATYLNRFDHALEGGLL